MSLETSTQFSAPEERARQEEVSERLAQPSPWLVEASHKNGNNFLPRIKRPPAIHTTEEMRQMEEVRDQLDRPSPWH